MTEIGYWSELKLEIVEKYGSAYTSAFKNTRLKKYYTDGLYGAGIHFSNAVVYYLFFASQKPVAQKVISDIFRRYR
jgi:hypothetical protein